MITNDNDSNEKLLQFQYTPNPELDNDISKLMYYLNCINIVIQVNIYHKYIDYLNPNNISKEEEEIILNLALKYKPKILIDNGVFILNQNLLKENSSNEFYQLNDERIETKVNPEILIEGNVINPTQLMACNYGWISTYYHEPIESINKKKIGIANVSYQQPNINDDNNNNINNNNNNGDYTPVQVNEQHNTNNNMHFEVNAANNRNNRPQNNCDESCSTDEKIKCCLCVIILIVLIIISAAKGELNI